MWFRATFLRRADWPGVGSSGWSVDYGRRIYAWGLGREDL